METWENSNLQVFWKEIAPCDHILQIYEDDQLFLDGLEGFIGSGILAGDTVIVIATDEHLIEIEKRLDGKGFDTDLLSTGDRYIALDAQEMLSRFMVNNWPDEKLFMKTIGALLKRIHRTNRNVRAFGEMVALLWQQGLTDATVQLESLWNKVQAKNQFTLFCAYPKIGLTDDMHNSMDKICCAHNKIIDGRPRPSEEVYYKTA